MPSLLIYIHLHFVRRLSSSATYVATLICSSTILFRDLLTFMDIIWGVLSLLKNSVRARASSSITLKPKSPMLNGTKIGHTLIANAPFVNSRNSWLTRKRVQGSRKCFKRTALFWFNATWLWFDSFFWSYTSDSGCLKYLHTYFEKENWKKYLRFYVCDLHCKCFVCWNHRRIPANQILRQLAVI